ncbi:MAG: hypothetical protein OEX12_07065 [Gammaproteobacteria bacterium]|nr:hypothetical protein [Gammaproteobacteria bacterium]
MSDIDARRQQVIKNESSKSGLRGKINAKCAECIFDPYGGGGTWREQVRDCTAKHCPLFEVRPMPKTSSVTA